MDLTPKSQDDLQPLALLVIIIILLMVLAIPASSEEASPQPAKCDKNNGGITLSPGFCATVFADRIGHARHMAVAPNGAVYVNTWSGRYYGYDQPPPGGFLVALQDTKGSGHADKIQRFGGTIKNGSAGGTGIALYKGALYAEVNDRIERYALPSGAGAPSEPPEVIVSGLPLSGDHPMHPFRIDAQGKMYVDLGSATNACQNKTAWRTRPALIPVRSWKPERGRGSMTPTRPDSAFRPPSALQPGFETGKGSLLTTRAGSLPRSMAAISLSRTGPNSIVPNKGPTSLPKNWFSSKRGRILDGPIAISICR